MKDSPTPPDPYVTADAQTKSNLATATAQQNMNMVNQTNPYGSLTYTQTGTNPDGTPKYTATTQLNGAQQGLLDQSNNLKSGQLGIAQQLLNSGSGALSGKGLDLSYNGTTAALDKLARARLDPQWQQNSEMNEAKLAAQGLSPGMAGYDAAMRNFNVAKNDAYNSSNLANYGLSSQNALAEYNAPLAAYQSLTGTGQPTNFSPMSTPTTNVAGTNIAGLINSNYQQESQNANAANGQMAGLLGTGLSLAAAPFTGGASLLGAGAMGGLFGGGGGTASTMNYGGQSWPAYR